ncbi:uncharacterized protein LOC127790883 [Diospyros lotus]|uniref:uncharacterized protein LOC127790883 n=1 Tax=Diospyros lotus TaxID=55363 RepID=UPI00224F15BE|nr:uncharacterized protein LOC127790883 [Diospyros lotus]
MVAAITHPQYTQTRAHRELDDLGYGGTPAKELLYIFCWKKPSSLSSTTALNPQELRSDSPSAEDWWPKTELAGSPRFLFTIKEEMKEDLESEDDKSRKWSRSRSLSDRINVSVETPFLTPIASPPYFMPSRSPIAFSGNGFNPLSE